MKKILSLILVLMLATGVAALAEETAAPITSIDFGTIELNYEPAWISFDNGMQIAIPSDWTEIAVSDDVAATGVFYMAQNPDATMGFGIVYAELGLTDLDSLAAMLATMYPSLGIITANGITMIAYDETDGSYSALITLDGQGGMYMLTFAPVVEDETLTMTAVGMMTTLGPVEAAETSAN